jgi:hypothetical protein
MNIGLRCCINIVATAALLAVAGCDSRNKSHYYETQTRRNTDYDPHEVYDSSLEETEDYAVDDTLKNKADTQQSSE